MNLTRRRFLNSLRFGASATLLHSFAGGLFDTAWGAVPTRKVGFWVLTGNGFPTAYLQPANLGLPENTSAAERAGFEVPYWLSPLKSDASRMVLFDGLGVPGYQDNHTSGYTCLSGVPGGSYEPTGITVDQFCANTICKDAAKKSVLFGLTNKPTDASGSKFFASAAQVPTPFFARPSTMYESLFGQVAGSAEASIRKRREGLLLASMQNDIVSLRTKLAAPERIKLDALSAVLEDFDIRQRKLAEVSCGGAPAASVDGGIGEDRYESMLDMAAIAVACGLTNVVGMSVGAGFTHGGCFTQWERISKGTRFEKEHLDATNQWVAGPTPIMSNYGHGPEEAYRIANTQIHWFAMALVARFRDVIGKVPQPQGRNLWDDTTVFWANDNGDRHHSGRQRWSAMVLTDTSKTLKGGQRYIRYETGKHSIGTVHSAVANALGAKNDSFAGQTPNRDLLT